MQPAWNSPACAVLSLSDPIVSDSTISYLSSYFSSQTLTIGSFSVKIEYEYKFNFIAHSEVCMTNIASLSAFSEISCQKVSLPQGTVCYYDQGTGPTLVFIHGLLANRLLWSRVIPDLVSHFRCIAPDLPLGAHSHSMHPDADLSPLGVAHLVAAFLEALDLHEVTLIGNDTGGAICQLVIAHHPERISSLVLTNCDAFEQFFPPLVSPFHYGPRVFDIRFANFLAWVLRARSAQRLFVAALAHRRPELEELDAFFHPLLHLPGARRDMTRFLQAVSNRYTLEAARCFSGFGHPVLLLWGKDDPFFSQRLARRLQQAFPDARLHFLSHCRAFVPVDQPGVFAQYITEFVHAAV
jgi:pimeloyl-ACP methyl ester carboxylesterase